MRRIRRRLYADLLGGFATRELPLICANPDLVVERGGKIVPCAGSVALAYEADAAAWRSMPASRIGRSTRRPWRLRRRSGALPIDRSRICAVGDAIRTDIAGAEGFGAAGIMVLAGIHAQDLMEASWEERHGWFGQPDAPPVLRHAASGLVRENRRYCEERKRRSNPGGLD